MKWFIEKKLLNRRFIAVFAWIFVIITEPVHIWANQTTNSNKLLPSTIIGIWQVVKVSVDTKSTRRLHVQYNDPNEKGRIVAITPEKITNDGVDWMICTHPTVTVKRTTAAELIKESMGWRWFDPEIPTPKDYELPFANEAMIDSLWINCENGHFGPGAKDITQNTWMLPLPHGQLAMRWFDETVLILSRLPANAKPKPSFDCTKAKTAVEKTICGSVSLASFDLSVAKSYSNGIQLFKEEENPKELKQLKEAQKAWLARRNACGADAACIKKSMLDQLDYLTTNAR